MSSIIAQAVLSELHLNYYITIGLLLIEITIKKGIGQVWKESSALKVWYYSIGVLRDVSVLDEVISVRDWEKQCDLSIDEILVTIEIIYSNHLHVSVSIHINY